MTVFGWLTVFFWAYGAATVKSNTPSVAVTSRLVCLFMAFGTMVWGTGSL